MSNATEGFSKLFEKFRPKVNTIDLKEDTLIINLNINENTAFNVMLGLLVNSFYTYDDYGSYLLQSIIKDETFSDGSRYIVHSGDLISIKEKSNNISYEFNNLSYEKINCIHDEAYSNYYLEFSGEFNVERAIKFDVITGEFIVQEGENSTCFELQNVGDGTTFLETIDKSYRFISHLLGKFVALKVYNNDTNEVQLNIHSEQISPVTMEDIDSFQKVLTVLNADEMMKIWEIRNNFTIKHKSALVDFTIAFGNFEEKLKSNYIQEILDTSENKYPTLLELYKRNIYRRVDDQLRTDELQIQGLNSKQRKIYKEGLKKKFDKTNDLPYIIMKYKYADTLCEMCQTHWKCERPLNLDISEITNSKKISSKENRTLWEIRNLLLNPRELTNFRNINYHTSEIGNDVNKLRIYSEIIQIIMYFSELLYLEINVNAIDYLFSLWTRKKNRL